MADNNANNMVAGNFTLRKQLKKYLVHRGMTASELARRCGVARQVISDWMSGVRPRSLEHLKRVADELEVTIDHLCFGNGLMREVVRVERDESWVEGVFEIRFRRLGDNDRN